MSLSFRKKTNKLKMAGEKKITVTMQSDVVNQKKRSIIVIEEKDSTSKPIGLTPSQANELLQDLIAILQP